MSLTLPQLILLNHASKVNKDRSDARWEVKKRQEERLQQQEEDDPIVWGGKRLSELNSIEMAAYYGDFTR